MSETSNYSGVIFTAIRDNYDAMTQTRKQIADCLMNSAENISTCSITEFAERAGVKSEASIVRFYRMLGFNNYNDFRIQLTQDLVSGAFNHSVEEIDLDDSVADLVKKTFYNNIHALEDGLNNQSYEIYETAANSLMNAKRVILLSYGASAAIAYYAQFRFLKLGIDCFFSPDAHSTLPMVSQLKKDDLIICISASGETSDIVKMLNNRPEQETPVITLTCVPESTIGKMSDVIIDTHAQEMSCFTDVMCARAIMLTSIDVLYTIAGLAGGREKLEHLANIRKLFNYYKTPMI